MQNNRDPIGVVLWAVGLIVSMILFLVGIVINGNEITIAKSLLLFPVITGVFVVISLLLLQKKDRL